MSRVLVAVLASAAAAFFYVRLIVLMFFTDVPEGQEDAVEVEYSPLTRTVIAVAFAGTVLLGIEQALGLSGGGGQPILAAGIAALTSTVEIFLVTRYAQGVRFALPRLPLLRWFVWSGIFTGGAFLFMYIAFSLERVSIVAPLVNSYTVFVAMLTPFMARQIEEFTPRKLAGAALVVAGIFAVSLGKD